MNEILCKGLKCLGQFAIKLYVKLISGKLLILKKFGQEQTLFHAVICQVYFFRYIFFLLEWKMTMCAKKCT